MSHGVVTDLEPDILGCEVRWALGSFTVSKASGGDGIPAELFKVLKDDSVKVLHSVCQQIWKTQQWSQDWKKSVFIPVPKKGNARECSIYHTIAFISHASKVMPSILEAKLQQYMNQELSNVQTGFWRGRGTRDQIANPCWIMEKARELKNKIKSACASLTMLSLWLCGSQQSLENSSGDGNTRPPYLSPEKPVCSSRRNS